MTPRGQKIKEKAVFTVEEVEVLWNHVLVPGVDITLLLRYTGMRISELMTLPTKQINLEEQYIQYGIKTEAGKHRIIPIPDRILPLIKKYYNPSNCYLIEKDGDHMKPDYYRKRLFAPMIKRLGLNKELTPHRCRHYYATLLNNNVDNKTTIKNLMGHSDYSTTANIYTHQDIFDLVPAVKSL